MRDACLDRPASGICHVLIPHCECTLHWDFTGSFRSFIPFLKLEGRHGGQTFVNDPVSNCELRLQLVMWGVSQVGLVSLGGDGFAYIRGIERSECK
jgi:hypothetical protein